MVHVGTFEHVQLLFGKCGYFWTSAGTFGLGRKHLDMHGYFWARWYCLARVSTFGHAQVLLGARGYFWACMGNLGERVYFWVRAGSFGCIQVLLGACKYFRALKTFDET